MGDGYEVQVIKTEAGPDEKSEDELIQDQKCGNEKIQDQKCENGKIQDQKCEDGKIQDQKCENQKGQDQKCENEKIQEQKFDVKFKFNTAVCSAQFGFEGQVRRIWANSDTGSAGIGGRGGPPGREAIKI